MKKTKMICTMGPNTNDRELIKQMTLAGMDIARFNFSHGDHEEQKGRFRLVESVREELNIPVATLLIQRDQKLELAYLNQVRMLSLRITRSSHLQQEKSRVMRQSHQSHIRDFLRI